MDILRPPSATSEREIPATPRAARGEQRSARIQGRPKSHATVASAGYRSFSPCPATEWKSAALSASMHAPPCCPPVGSDGRCSHAMVEFAHRIFQSGTRRIWEEFKKEEELPVNGELLWDNGTPFPEPCIDRLAPHIGKYEALAWLCRGLGFFAALGVAAAVNDKASKIPYGLQGTNSAGL